MKLSPTLRSWYREIARDLPWRNTQDSYAIWLSEIILQQTRVNQGLPYFNRFIERFPSVVDLANAPEDEVLKLWEGLGYYSRARNLHKGAKHMAEIGIPSNYSDWLKVPGVGPYTAAAVSSFAFDEAKAVVDGNVNRVIARLLNIDLPVNTSAGAKAIQTAADELLGNNPPAEHNQAIMELGALICTPKQPRCSDCPWQPACEGFAKNTISNLPVKLKKTTVKPETLHYTVAYGTKGIYFDKRDDSSIWKGLYHFIPKQPSELTLPANSVLHLSDYRVTHLLSHRRLDIHIHKVYLPSSMPTNIEDTPLVHWDAINDLAFPRPLRTWLDDNLVHLRLEIEG